MTVVDIREPGVGPDPVDPRFDVRVRTLSSSRKVKDRLVTVAIYAAVLLAVVPLISVIIQVVAKGAKGFSLDFLTHDVPHLTNLTPELIKALHISTKPAAGPAVLGTLLITGAASAMAIPLGVLGALYLNEFGKQGWFARVVRFMADVMTGVPSIVMGLFLYTVWVLNFGEAGLAGAFALACLMLPIVIRTAEEMLRLVPDELRSSSLALGSRRWRTVWSVVLPAAIPGITSGSMLAVARAAGETAPILFTIGVVSKPNPSLSGQNTTLSWQIWNGAKIVDPLGNQIAWTAALTLVALVFILTLAARFISSRFSTTAQR